jgi:hypothetical protein
LRSKDQVRTGLSAHFQIAFQRSGVLTEIFIRPELSRVNEDRAHDKIAFLASSLNQTYMARMQRAHGWNATDRFSRVASFTDKSVCFGWQWFHNHLCLTAKHLCNKAVS